jgi:signal transduction histidine kinase
MAANDPAEIAYDQLRRLAAGDPRRAREEFVRLATDQSRLLAGILELASGVSEGRVRHVVATVARGDAKVRSQVLGWLNHWGVSEADEFTRRAINLALTPVATTTTSTTTPPPPTLAELPAGFTDTYRYVSERLCHRIRNALAPADTELIRLERLIRSLPDPASRAAMTDVLGGLLTGFDRAARVVEFDRRDGYLAWSPIDVVDWVKRAATEFAGRYGAAKLVIRDSGTTPCAVRATPFLLDVLFGNLWSNAIQAVGAGCEFILDVRRTDRVVEILVLDSGPGFTETTASAIFSGHFSTRPGNTGRGMLEVAEAVERLHGNVCLTPVSGSNFRLLVRLPLERS